jgi:hypothetical protein
MDLSVIDTELIVKLLLLLLIGMGPKIALVPFLEKTKHLDAETQRAGGGGVRRYRWISGTGRQRYVTEARANGTIEHARWRPARSRESRSALMTVRGTVTAALGRATCEHRCSVKVVRWPATERAAYPQGSPVSGRKCHRDRREAHLKSRRSAIDRRSAGARQVPNFNSQGFLKARSRLSGSATGASLGSTVSTLGSGGPSLDGHET